MCVRVQRVCKQHALTTHNIPKMQKQGTMRSQLLFHGLLMQPALALNVDRVKQREVWHCGPRYSLAVLVDSVMQANPSGPGSTKPKFMLIMLLATAHACQTAHELDELDQLHVDMNPKPERQRICLLSDAP